MSITDDRPRGDPTDRKFKTAQNFNKNTDDLSEELRQADQ